MEDLITTLVSVIMIKETILYKSVKCYQHHELPKFCQRSRRILRSLGKMFILYNHEYLPPLIKVSVRHLSSFLPNSSSEKLCRLMRLPSMLDIDNITCTLERIDGIIKNRVRMPWIIQVFVEKKKKVTNLTDRSSKHEPPPPRKFRFNASMHCTPNDMFATIWAIEL